MTFSWPRVDRCAKEESLASSEREFHEFLQISIQCISDEHEIRYVSITKLPNVQLNLTSILRVWAEKRPAHFGGWVVNTGLSLFFPMCVEVMINDHRLSKFQVLEIECLMKRDFQIARCHPNAKREQLFIRSGCALNLSFNRGQLMPRNFLFWGENIGSAKRKINLILSLILFKRPLIYDKRYLAESNRNEMKKIHCIKLSSLQLTRQPNRKRNQHLECWSEKDEWDQTHKTSFVKALGD